VTCFVFAVFSEAQADLVSTWIASWEARGWQTRLLSTREVQEAGGDAVKAMRCRCVRLRASHARLTDLLTINFALSAKRPGKWRLVRLNRRGWKTSPLVKFPPGTTRNTIFNCGRQLWL